MNASRPRPSRACRRAPRRGVSRAAATMLAGVLLLPAVRARAADRFPVADSSMPRTQDLHAAHAALGAAVLAAIVTQIWLMRPSSSRGAASEAPRFAANAGLWYAFWDPELTYGLPGRQEVLRSANDISPALVYEVGVRAAFGDTNVGLDYAFDRLNRALGERAGMDRLDRAVSILRGHLASRLGERWLLASSASYGRFRGGVRGHDYESAADGTVRLTGDGVPVNTEWLKGELLVLWARPGSPHAFGGGLRFGSYTGPVLVARFERDVLAPTWVRTESAAARDYSAVLGSYDLRRLQPHLFPATPFFVGADLSVMAGAGTLSSASAGKVVTTHVGGEVDVHVGVGFRRAALTVGYRNMVLYRDAGSGGPRKDGDQIVGVSPGTVVRSLDFFHGPSIQLSGSY